MSLRFQNILAILAATVVLGLLGLTFYVSLQEQQHGGRFTRDAVRGVSIIVDGKPYTLNFSQQQRLLAHLDRSQPFGGQSMTSAALTPVSGIVIHRFEGDDQDLELLGWDGKNLVFRVMGQPQAFVDSSGGEIYSLLETAHD